MPAKADSQKGLKTLNFRLRGKDNKRPMMRRGNFEIGSRLFRCITRVDGISSQLYPRWRALVFFSFLVCLLLFPIGHTIFAEQSSLSPQPSQSTSAQPTPTDTTSKGLQRLTDQVRQLESDLAKASKDSQNITVTTAIIAGSATLAAAIFGGVITLIGAYFTAKREERRATFQANRDLELARQEALFQHGEKFLEFRLKQMGFFYAPMFALLKQSKALYDKMSLQLVSDDPEQYKLLKKDDSNEPCLHVYTEDRNWEEFRLLDQLPAVRTYPNILTLVERIIHIGEQMTKIISEHAGLASEDLVDLLGEYLAHHAILAMIYKQNETKPYKAGSHMMGYFPRELPNKIIQGYNEISALLNEYEKKTKQVLQAFPEKVSEMGV